VRIDFTIAHARAEALDRLDLSINGLPCDVRLSRPEQRLDLFEATATVMARLHPRDCSVAELRLTEAQRSQDGQVGIGMAEIVLEPLGLHALRNRARAFAAACWSRAAGRAPLNS
jgi:hypothetical protein